MEHGNPYIRDMVEQYRRRRDLALNILRKHNLFSYTPHGAFYVLVDISGTGMESNAFADRLLKEQRVAVAPGATFGETARRSIRITLAAEERVVAEGLERICAFIKANAAT